MRAVAPSLRGKSTSAFAARSTSTMSFDSAESVWGSGCRKCSGEGDGTQELGQGVKNWPKFLSTKAIEGSRKIPKIKTEIDLIDLARLHFFPKSLHLPLEEMMKVGNNDTITVFGIHSIHSPSVHVALLGRLHQSRCIHDPLIPVVHHGIRFQKGWCNVGKSWVKARKKCIDICTGRRLSNYCKTMQNIKCLNHAQPKKNSKKTSSKACGHFTGGYEMVWVCFAYIRKKWSSVPVEQLPREHWHHLLPPRFTGNRNLIMSSQSFQNVCIPLEKLYETFSWMARRM